jgi:outer membrane lipoprotein-sorting protein
MRHRWLRLVALVSPVTIATAAAQPSPKTGADVLQRMHDAYAGKWYKTLTFVQKTTIRRRDGTDTVNTWYESLRHTDAHGTQLRIDADLAAGNGVLYTADSSWVVRAGKLVATRASGNEFLPLIEGVYVQPVARTVKELDSAKIDMSRVTRGEWKGRPAWIVGASSTADTTSTQFWVDVERNVVVRMLLSPSPNVPVLDIHLDGYVPLAGGWLATKIMMTEGGKPRQGEDYSDWKANVKLDDALFSVEKWGEAKHWAKAGTP